MGFIFLTLHRLISDSPLVASDLLVEIKFPISQSLLFIQRATTNIIVDRGHHVYLYFNLYPLKWNFIAESRYGVCSINPLSKVLPDDQENQRHFQGRRIILRPNLDVETAAERGPPARF